MPAGNNYSLGSDTSIVIRDSIQGIINLSIVTDFDDKETSKMVSVEPMQGPILRDDVPQGWEGSFGVDRGNTAVDDYFTTRANLFQSTAVLPLVTIFKYTDEVGGGQSVWQYSGCSLKLTEGGHYSGPAAVKQKISFTASAKVRIS